MKILAKPIAWIVTGLVLVALVGLTLRSCSEARQAGGEARYSSEKQKSASDSGKDAVATVGASGRRESDIDGTVKGGNDEIRKAPAGDSNAAADRAACGMRSYRRSRRCVELLGPPPK